MKIVRLFMCLMLIASIGNAANDVQIHFNYPDDNVYVGTSNKLEIWIENDVIVHGLSIGFEFTDYEGIIDWNASYGNSAPVNTENDAVDAFSGGAGISSNVGNLYDGYLPDSVLLAGIYIPAQTDGLLPMSPRLCYTMEFDIPSGQPLGEICVSNIIIPPAGDWLFYESYENEFAPDYNGCTNTGLYAPDCSKICFDIVAAPAPVADFSFTPDSGDYPLTVNFTDLSLYSPTSWTWVFGDGDTAYAQNPSHEYLVAGTYYPVLTVSNAVGENTKVSTVPVIVTDPPIFPGVSITCPATQPTVSGITDTVMFTIENTGEDADDFEFFAVDSLGWFLSPTFQIFTLDGGMTTQIPVGVIIPDGLGTGVENLLTGSVTSQTLPEINDTAFCRLILDNELCGDVNLDGKVNISDAIWIINFIFTGGAAPCDVEE